MVIYGTAFSPISCGSKGLSGARVALAKDVIDHRTRNRIRHHYVNIVIAPLTIDVQEGWAIYDLLKASGKKINTVGEGKIYSIATVIFLAGENREIMPNADGLIHLPHFPEYSLAGRYEADDLVKLARSLIDETHHLVVLGAVNGGILPLEDVIDFDGVRDPCQDQNCHLVHHTGEPQENVCRTAPIHIEELMRFTACD